MSEDIEETIKDRDGKYGSFRTFAIYLQELKNAADLYHSDLSPGQITAMDMIFVKIARILNGNPNIVDNWHDIAVFARLVEIELTREDVK